MKKKKYFDRDLSWLSFNERVLMEANTESVPLYERIKFLAIYSSNLDEFFRVRVALIRRLSILNKEKLNSKTDLASPIELLKAIHTEVNKQQNLFGNIFKKKILPELKENKVILCYAKAYAEDHLATIEELFYSKILSFIQPIIITRDDKTPLFLENRKLYFISELERNGIQYIGIVNIPSDQLSRFQVLPKLNDCFYFTFIDDIIKQYSKVIFSGFSVKNNYSVKLNRDAELFLEDDYSDDVESIIKKKLSNRRVGAPSRFLYDPRIAKSILDIIRKKLELKREDCIPGGEYHNMFDLFSLPNPIGKKLENLPLPALQHAALNKRNSLFDAIEKKDILLAFPFQKYDYVLRLFNEAAIDPAVISIKATLYRVAHDSHITNALISAARNGKEVTVLVEAKARFDEENNLEWAEKMKKAGVVVKFSSQAIKVHSKVALITRLSENKKNSKYAFLGTGNFNEKTADIYTDFAVLTADRNLTDEVDDTFDFILGRRKKLKLNHLLVARVNMIKQFCLLIDKEINASNSGKKGQIILKLNNLQDKKMINKLYKAADSGVQVDLIVRGICCLIPRKNIRLIRIVDRFLEHARVYMFHNAGEEKIFVGSADWMERNLYRRIEVVFPIYDKDAKELIQRNISFQFADNTKATTLSDNLENLKFESKNKAVRSQYEFYQYLRMKNTPVNTETK